PEPLDGVAAVTADGEEPGARGELAKRLDRVLARELSLHRQVGEVLCDPGERLGDDELLVGPGDLPSRSLLEAPGPRRRPGVDGRERFLETARRIRCEAQRLLRELRAVDSHDDARTGRTICAAGY